MPKFLDEGLGIKFNIVTGYPGGGEIDLGIERGELHCRNLTISTYFAREPFLTWHKKGFVRPDHANGKEERCKSCRCSDDL